MIYAFVWVLHFCHSFSSEPGLTDICRGKHILMLMNWQRKKQHIFKEVKPFIIIIIKMEDMWKLNSGCSPFLFSPLFYLMSTGITYDVLDKSNLFSNGLLSPLVFSFVNALKNKNSSFMKQILLLWNRCLHSTFSLEKVTKNYMGYKKCIAWCDQNKYIQQTIN